MFDNEYKELNKFKKIVDEVFYLDDKYKKRIDKKIKEK